MKNWSIKVKNHKCFGNDPQGFDKILPINLIIGKNNSGKSSLIDLIKFTTDLNKFFIPTGRNKINSEVIIEGEIEESDLTSIFSPHTSGGGIPEMTHFHYGKLFIGEKLKFNLSETRRNFLGASKKIVPQANDKFQSLANSVIIPLQNKHFLRINAERDITPESQDPTTKEVHSNGNGLTNLVRQIINDARLDPNIVRKDLLTAINEIIYPDIKFKDITPREENNIWQIYFEDNNENLIPLSRMGSGVKTILLVLANLLIIPSIQGYRKSDLILAFEELENNLHPSLQRRLIKYIINYCEKQSCIFFITTHSSIIIDMFKNYSNAQLIHLMNNEGHNETVTKSVISINESRNILKDLEFRPSDLLMSNGIVWVEGPSDIIYLELFISLYQKANQNNSDNISNYTIQSLSTAMWKYAGFEETIWEITDSDIENKLVTLANLNMNHLIIIDGDSNYDTKKPSEWNTFTSSIGKLKAKLINSAINFSSQNESNLNEYDGLTKDNTLLFWITNQTIESYLEYFINTKGGNFKEYFDHKKERGFFEKKRSGNNHSISKVELAKKIVEFASIQNLSFSDFAEENSELEVKIKALINTISSWN